MLKRLRIKFICINMLIVTVMLGVIFGTVFHFTGKGLRDQSIRTMQEIGSQPFHIERPETVPDSFHGPTPKERQDKIHLPYFAALINQQGEVIATKGGYYDLSDQEELESLLDAVLDQREETGVLKEYRLRYCRVANPAGESIVFTDITSEQVALGELLKNFALIGAASFLVFLIISVFLSRWAIKPVEKAWQQQNQFVADASHELKTPLTVIMTNAELLQKKEAAEGQEPYADNILVMSQRMRALVEGLLELARVDNGAVRAAFREVDLSSLVNDAVLPFEPLYFEKGLMLESHVEGGIKVTGSADHLRQVADILLDNAMKYSSPAQSVQWTLKRQGNMALLRLTNTGEPLSHEECRLIFERFYRKDKSRGETQGYGLGLSIAKGIVAEHKGKIWAESENGRTTFFVTLPIS